MRRISLFVIAALASALFIAGCSAPWNAPVERRSGYNPSGGRIEGPTDRVKSGDTLYGIAWRASVDYQDLARWNRIAPPYTIYVNQKLSVVPGRSTTTSTAKAKSGSTGKKQTAKKTTTVEPAKSKTTTSKTKSSKNIACGSLRWSWAAK